MPHSACLENGRFPDNGMGCTRSCHTTVYPNVTGRSSRTASLDGLSGKPYANHMCRTQDVRTQLLAHTLISVWISRRACPAHRHSVLAVSTSSSCGVIVGDQGTSTTRSSPCRPPECRPRSHPRDQGSRMKVCDPMLGADFGEIVTLGACLAWRKTRLQGCP